MEKMRMESLDGTKQNIERIGALFPNCVTEAKDEEGRGHEIQREHIKLDADPEHQGNAKDPAEDYAKFLLSQKQSRRCQICQAVYDQQGNT